MHNVCFCGRLCKQVGFFFKSPKSPGNIQAPGFLLNTALLVFAVVWNSRAKFSCYLSPTDLQYCKINYISCISRLSAFVLPFQKHYHLSTANFGAFTFHALALQTSRYVSLSVSCTWLRAPFPEKMWWFQCPSCVGQYLPNYDMNTRVRFWYYFPTQLLVL